LVAGRSEAKEALIIWLISFVAEPMNNIVIDTNPFVYIYHNVPDSGKNYTVLLVLTPIHLKDVAFHKPINF